MEDEPDLADILAGLKLSYHRLHLMEKLGFKLVSQLRVCSLIVDICDEWDLQKLGSRAVRTGVQLAQCLYGSRSQHAKQWISRGKLIENIS